MMDIYLPIAEISVNLLVVLAIGGAVGFVSGMFGVGGGFLITPLLIFIGVPPPIAVATGANEIVASSMSGIMAHWRRRTVDIKMGLVLSGAGILGSGFGVLIFSWLQRAGQIDVAIGLSYVVLLVGVGALMLRESISTILANRAGTPPPIGQRHQWFHGLPLKMRFPRSRLYTSVLPIVGLGFGVGILSAIMGVGGGFILVPALIYLIGMPTSVVVGTGLLQVLIVSAATTLFQAWANQTVDILLALLMLFGAVVGAQYGARIGVRLPGEQLRAMMGLLVLGVACRIAYGLIITPEDIYTISIGGSR
jgi:uncharacterized membrane protein YfcA